MAGGGNQKTVGFDLREDLARPLLFNPRPGGKLLLSDRLPVGSLDAIVRVVAPRVADRPRDARASIQSPLSIDPSRDMATIRRKMGHIIPPERERVVVRSRSPLAAVSDPY